MKSTVFLLTSGLVFVMACNYDHSITDTCEIHPDDKLSEILIGDWNMERVTENPAVLLSPDSMDLWNGVAERPNLNLKPDGKFEWGSDTGTWRTDDNAETLTLDYSSASQTDHILDIFGFNRCYFAFQDTSFLQAYYFQAVKY
jgi:hypothetical protein